MKKISIIALTILLAACNNGSTSDSSEPKEPNEENLVVCYVDEMKDECDKTRDVVDGESKFGEGTW